MTKPFPDYKVLLVSDLVPYARNSRTHSAQQVDKIAASIKEFGFLNPIITDGENGIVAGHGRVLAAQKLGLETLPVIEAAHLTEAQRRAYVIADNRLALDAGWDNEMLKIELKDLDSEGFDLTLTGFELGEMSDIFAGVEPGAGAGEGEAGTPENYSRKIEAPIYEITGEKPTPAQLYDRTKTEQLQAKIEQASLPDEVKAFLKYAAERHTVFNFSKIAEFYAHSEADVQELFEQSALVIIDFQRAIEEGFVQLSKELLELSGLDDE
ncbi:MAG: ParB/Srx family N-terminal domain-containing protein [Opitutia bacterium]